VKCFRAVAGLSSSDSQMESGQGAQSFNHGMDLRAQSAAGTSERLITFFFCTRGMLMCAHNRSVDKHFFKIGITGQLREEPMPDAMPRRPRGKALVAVALSIPESDSGTTSRPGLYRLSLRG